MELSAITRCIRQSKVSNGSNSEIGWVVWSGDQQKTPFSEGVTIIENKALLTRRYTLYIVCVKESKADEELTDAEDNASDDEIAMTPKISGRNLNSYDRTSIPESPEMEDSDNDSIILNSQEEFSTRNKRTRSPETLAVLNCSSRSSPIELRLEDSTLSVHDEIKTKSVSEDPSDLPDGVDIHEVLTQPIPRSEIQTNEIDNDDNINEQETELSDYEHETETSVYEQETEMVINKIGSIKGMIDKDSRTIRGGKYNIHEEETQRNDELPQITDNKSETTKKDFSTIEKIAIDKQQTKKITVNVGPASDAFMADSVICDFEVTDEPEYPDSPDSTSLLVDYGNITSNKEQADNCDINPEDDDPYNQDTQIMDPLTKAAPSQYPSLRSQCTDLDDDELTQVVDEDIILSTRVDGKIDAKNSHKKGPSKAEDAFKKFKVPDENSIDIKEEDIFTAPTQNFNVQNVPPKLVDISNTCTENLLDAPTQKIEEAPIQKFLNISRVPMLNIETDEPVYKNQDIFMDSTQEDISDAPTQKIVEASEAPILPHGNVNIRLRKRLSSTDFKMGSSLNSRKTSFPGTQELFDHLKSPAQGFMKRKILTDSNNGNDSFIFSTPAKIDKKNKGKAAASDASFNEFFTTDTINLNSLISSPRSVKKDNYYNNTREIEDDLLSQTIVSVIEKSPLHQTDKKVQKSSQDDSSPLTNKNILTGSKDRDYYGCTQEVMEDLLTQQNPDSSPIISPVKYQSSKRKLTPSDEAKFDSKTKKGNPKNNFHNENDFYQCTQDIVDDLLTPASNLEVQNPNYEECSNEARRMFKNSSQLSDSCSETFENVTPLKRGFKHTISHSDLDSPQIKTFALSTMQSDFDRLSNSDIEDDCKKDTEDDIPIVFRKKVPKKKQRRQSTIDRLSNSNIEDDSKKNTEDGIPIRFQKTVPKKKQRRQSTIDRLSNSNIEDDSKKDTEDGIPICFQKTVPKKKQRRQSTVEEVKQSRSSSRVKKSFDSMHSSETSDKDSENFKASSKNNPKILVRRASVVIERCKELDLDNFNKKDKNKAANNMGKTGKASAESSSSKSKNVPNISSRDIDNESVTEKIGKRDRKNVTKEIKGNQISDECHSKTEVNESDSENIEKRSSRGRNRGKMDINYQENTLPSKKTEDKKYTNIKPIENVSVVVEPLTIDKGKKSKILLGVAGSSEISVSHSDAKGKKMTSRDGLVTARVQCRGEESVPEKISTNKRTFRKEDSNTSKKDSSTIVEKCKSAINTEQKNVSDRRKKPQTEVAKQDSSNTVNAQFTALKVMFTRLDNAKAANMVVKLGGTVVEQNGDVLVSGCSKRTVKLMMAIARGKPVVSKAWLVESSASRQFLDPWEYLLKDEILENRFKFSLKSSLVTAKPYLNGWVIYLTPQILPKPQEMKELVEASGGQAEVVSGGVGRRSASMNIRGSAGTFSVTCTEDRHLWARLPRPLVSSEAIMMGAFKHTLLYEIYKLEE